MFVRALPFRALTLRMEAQPAQTEQEQESEPRERSLGAASQVPVPLMLSAEPLPAVEAMAWASVPAQELAWEPLGYSPGRASANSLSARCVRILASRHKK